MTLRQPSPFRDIPSIATGGTESPVVLNKVEEKMTEPSKKLSKTEQKLRELIQQAWCDIDNNPKDKFGDFLTRAVKAIKEAGYKSPEETIKVADFERWAKANHYVRLAELNEKLDHILMNFPRRDKDGHRLDIYKPELHKTNDFQSIKRRNLRGRR